MRHRRIPKSVRHKKLKSIESLTERRFVTDDIIQRTCDQPIPKRLKEIIESKQPNKRAHQEKIKKSKSKSKLDPPIIVKPSESFEIQPGMTRIPKPLPDAVCKEPGESQHHFMNRLNKMVAQSIAEATLEEHFEVDLGEKIPSSENHESGTKQSQLFQDEAETKKIDKKKEKNRLNRLRRKAKKMTKQHRLVKQLDKIDDISLARKDSFDFGDVVHCPPSFEFKNKNKIK